MANSADARARLASDLRMMVADTEELLRAVGSESKDKIAVVRPRLEAILNRTKTQLDRIEDTIEERARAIAREADQYAHENPWRTAGVAAGFGAALGAVIGVLLARR